MVRPGLVPPGELEAARRAICAFLGVELDDPATWYALEPLEWSVVPIHHPQAFWDIRQLPSVHAAFAELLGTEKLWVSMDRGIFKVPASSQHPAHVDESIVHWDLDPRASEPVLQGMLYLTDTSGGQGPFQGVPSIYRELDRYLQDHPELGDGAPLDLRGHEVVDVPAAASDLVIWDSRLPHHGGPNVGRAPRLSLALTMFPEGSEEERQERIACWRHKRAPAWWRGVKGQLDPEPGEPARLTSLGRRLLGLDRW